MTYKEKGMKMRPCLYMDKAKKVLLPIVL
jgi:hypothetical protein